MKKSQHGAKRVKRVKAEDIDRYERLATMLELLERAQVERSLKPVPRSLRSTMRVYQVNRR